jgi:hypothetical protein
MGAKWRDEFREWRTGGEYIGRIENEALWGSALRWLRTVSSIKGYSWTKISAGLRKAMILFL